MSKKWYPVIDYAECIECGACVGKCSHGVYNKEKAPVPIVMKPEKCIYKCHGCGNLCPVGAITYVGDNTGWVPPRGGNEAKSEDAGCGCSCTCGGNC